MTKGRTSQKLVDELNSEMGVSKAQAAAMLAGATQGWATPAADPKNYDEQGQPVKSRNRDRALSIGAPFTGHHPCPGSWT